MDFANLQQAGNSTEYCGGPNRLNVYQNSNPVKPTSTTTSSTTTSPTATSLPTTGTAHNLPTGWQYNGCYIDQAQGRILSYQANDNVNLTIESCVATCTAQGYTVAGVEYGVQCFCDNFLRNGAALTSASDCNVNCGGDSTEKCGAGNRMSIYSTGTLNVYQPPAVQTTNLPGSWTYQGCLTDQDGATRTFPYKNVLETNNTADNCLSLCSQFDYMAGGTEYGQECWCGDYGDIVNVNRTTLAPESDCNTVCSGNATQICGGGNRLSY